MIYDFDTFLKNKKTDVVFLIGSGSSLNDLTENQWNIINKYDNLGVNNIFYHPFFIPKMLHLELKSYDWGIAKERLKEKWEKGWKNVKYILPIDRSRYIADAIGHIGEATIFTYSYKSRGEHPKKNPNVKIDANFNPLEYLFKSYDTSVSTIIQILYIMGYRKIILLGLDMNNSKYFWTDMKPEIRGKVHDEWNKQREGKDKNQPHNASHLKNYIIDFNNRHMIPKKREIFVGHTTTSLYPELKYFNIEDLNEI